MERAGSPTTAFSCYWSKPVVIFTNMQQKGSTIVQEQKLLNLREVRGAFNDVCKSPLEKLCPPPPEKLSREQACGGTA
jgi:hypothetical protein